MNRWTGIDRRCAPSGGLALAAILAAGCSSAGGGQVASAGSSAGRERTSGPVHAILVAPGDTVAPAGVTLSGASGDFPLAAFTADGTPLVAWEASVGIHAAVGVSTHRR